MSAADKRPARGLLDTSVLLLAARLDDPSVLPAEPLISAMTLAELAVGSLLSDEEIERVHRQAHLQQVEAGFDPVPFDAAAARAFARVALSLRRAGKKPAARGYDAIIAAIAVSRGLTLYTCNPRDFEGIDGLEVVAVPVPV
jgi:tRNA(fMet)-specific endonuclease VapC